MTPPRYLDFRRDAKRKIMVPMTLEEAALAVEALRHVGREIFEDRPEGERLKDASTAVQHALDQADSDKPATATA
jgi:hypothetical protein